MGACYIVTDLAVEAQFDFRTLDAELKRAGLHGFRQLDYGEGVWRTSYSSSARGCGHPADAIDELLSIVEHLEGEAFDQWRRCSSRRFDMGFTAFDERFCSKWRVETSLLERLAAVKGDLVVTIYRDKESDRRTPLPGAGERPMDGTAN